MRNFFNILAIVLLLSSLTANQKGITNIEAGTYRQTGISQSLHQNSSQSFRIQVITLSSSYEDESGSKKLLTPFDSSPVTTPVHNVHKAITLCFEHHFLDTILFEADNSPPFFG